MAELICPQCSHPYKQGDEICRICGYIFPSNKVFPPGKILRGRYEITRFLHSGGVGYIYLAKDKNLFDRLCIIKQVRERIQSEEHKKKLEEEALRMSRLAHPNIAMIFDHFVESGHYFLVVEHIQGKTLSEVFKEHQGHLREYEVIRWAVSMCDVVTYIHREGIIHRDISPDNIMLTDDRSIKFIDFGTLRELRYIATERTAGIGKYGYTPPEQWKGKPQPGSDIFALGATIYYLLTGFIPQSNTYKTKKEPQEEDRSPQFPPIRHRNSDISPGLEAALEKALQLDIRDRYVSAVEMQKALCNLEDEETKRILVPQTKGSKIEPRQPESTIKWRSVSSAIQHPVTLLPLAVCILAVIYLFLWAPLFGGSWSAISIIIVFGILSAYSFVYNYRKELQSKTGESRMYHYGEISDRES